ncbi:prefoldin subunit [Candidatus Woesearchaeota archaeon]|nr:prefoldin subunit [Candidatus Woesearchaeota archaeon]
MEEEKIRKLQQLEHNMQTLMMQRQSFQSQLLDIESAERELEKPQKEIYKIMGTIMVSISQKDIQSELTEKREILNLRVKSIEKQESSLKQESEKIKKEVLEKLKK